MVASLIIRTDRTVNATPHKGENEENTKKEIKLSGDLTSAINDRISWLISLTAVIRLVTSCIILS
jgi:hypothetical protein